MDNHHHVRYRDLMVRYVLCITVFLVLGCDQGQDIEERFLQCREWTQDKDMRPQSLTCWSSNSRALLEALFKQKKSSSGLLGYLERYRMLLDYEDVESIDVYGDLAQLTVVKGRKVDTVTMVREDGDWMIDALELSGFWYELNSAVRVD